MFLILRGSDILRLMPNKPERKPDDPAQYKRFIEAARKAEADETKEGAERGFKKIDPRKRDVPKKQAR
jgi:hypothetical protein